MKSGLVVFITLNDYDNLGVGYMAAMLSSEGFEIKVIDPRSQKSYILKKLQEINPLLVGFSIIFLNHIELFADLADYLRRGGIKCHFTAGGHYASLKYGELFDLMPDLDSVIRFEGEYTFLELAKSVHSLSDWKEIKGLIYKDNGKTVANPLRSVECDLDKFPYPYRAPLKKYAFNKKFATILAGRGCHFNCSFCNTREFYSQATAPLKRIRKPELVAKEMEYLFHEKNCSVFIFHDDDFPLKTKMESAWVKTFCNKLEQNGLNRKVIWKINCRPDEVDEEKFELMKRNGLFLVFLGIEDGTNIGLNKLNKRVTVEENFRSISILKKLEIGFDYGFMLFNPDTTYLSLNENLGFLQQICGDGFTPVTFLKLLPLYENRVEKELIKSGRLKISDGKQDYDFTEKSMNQYYNFVTDNFFQWMRSPEGIENISKWARNYLLVYMHYFDPQPEGIKFYRKIRRITSESNLFFFGYHERALHYF
jgi:anaerobic magnesium-protoporphyrin IX monomethyl ester cyclase